MSEADAREDDAVLSTRSAAARAAAAMRELARAAVAGVRRRPWLLAALLAYAALLLALRPVTPFEWDEVLFQRSLDEYDVSQHWPHPPGYPVYVAAARATRAVVSDPLLALQLVGIVAAALALALVYRLVRRLGGSPWAGAAAAALTAAIPSFTFHANVGLSDVAGAAAGLAAVGLLLTAGERTAALPWAVAVSALALGVRPQLAALLAPLAVVALVRVVSRREWRQLAAAAVVGLVVTDVVWLTAMYATGPGFVPAWRDHARTLAAVERGLRLPAAGLGELAPFWLLRAFGSDALAWSFWALVGAGTFAWWRTGARRLVALYLGSAALYVVAGMFTMNMTTAARYVLPALPILAVLAAGIFALPGRAVRLAAAGLAGAWCLAAVVWAAPAYAVRRQPAPAWAALEWVRDHLDPARTTVVHDGFFQPHARYLLGQAGFTLVEAERTTTYPGWLRPDGSIVYVTPQPVAGGDVVFEKRWDSGALRRLTRSRYDEAAVTRAPRPGEPVYSPEWRVRDGEWELWGTGAICLAEQAQPRVVVLAAGDSQLRARRAAMPAVTVKPGERAEVPLMPGMAGCVLVNGPSGVRARFPAVAAPPLRAAAAGGDAPLAVVLPLVAELSEPGRAEWRSDVFLNNIGDAPLDLVAQFLPSGRDNGSAPAEAFTLPAGGRFVVKDVLSATGLRRWGRSGALMIFAPGPSAACGDLPCGFTAFSRTYNARAPRAGTRIGEGLPAIPARNGLYGGGKATFGGVSNDDAVTGYVSVATWIPAPVRARITLRDAEKREIAATEVEVPAFGHLFAPFPGRVTDGQLTVQLVKPPAKALFYPAVTLVNAATGEPTHLLATPSQKTAPPEWLLARPQRLPVAMPAR